MRHLKCLVLLTAAAISLSACSGIGGVAGHPELLVTVVDASGSSTPDESRLGGLVTQRLKIGSSWRSMPDLLSIRECDAAHSRCASGIAKPFVLVSVLDADSKSARVSVQVSYDIGPKQTVTNGLPASNSTATISIPDGVEPIRGHAEVSRSGELVFGELRKIDLPNGVMVGLCINSAAALVLSASGACHAGTAARFVEALYVAQPL